MMEFYIQKPKQRVVFLVLPQLLNHHIYFVYGVFGPAVKDLLWEI